MEQIRKRERATNFTNSEIRLLTELVTKYQSVIENKKTDAVTNKDKEDTWNKIASMFNASSSVTARTAKTLKLKYEGIKKLTKKKMATHRQELYRTGGGPSTAPDINDIEDKVLAICSNISGLDARNDSDNITNIQAEQCPVESVNLIHLVEDTSATSDLSDNQCKTKFDESFSTNYNKGQIKDSHNKWNTWNPSSLKSKKTRVLEATKASVTSKIDELSEARLQLVQLQMDIARKEHSFVEEQHNRKMLYLENDEKRKEEIHQMVLSTMQQNNLPK